MADSYNSRAYRAGIAVALVASLLIVWSTVVRDDGSGIGYFMVVLAAPVGAFAARFQSRGMARAMAGVALMQVLLGIAMATAPTTIRAQGSARAILTSLFFATLWLISAALFCAASRRGGGANQVSENGGGGGQG